jgi:hypothetical protein
VTRADHSVVTLLHASVENDSLVGAAADDLAARVAIPISEIRSVSTRTVSPGRTIALTGGIVLALGGVFLIIVIIQLSNSSWD